MDDWIWYSNGMLNVWKGDEIFESAWEPFVENVTNVGKIVGSLEGLRLLDGDFQTGNVWRRSMIIIWMKKNVAKMFNENLEFKLKKKKKIKFEQILKRGRFIEHAWEIRIFSHFVIFLGLLKSSFTYSRKIKKIIKKRVK